MRTPCVFSLFIGSSPRSRPPRCPAPSVFWNLLVHEYAQIDDDRVAGYLDRLGDLEAFVASVAGWIEREGQQGGA